MAGLQIGIQSEDASIEVVFHDLSPKKTPFGSFLLVSAIKGLIEESDVDSWGKEANELRPDDFYDMILGVIAQHYAQTVMSAAGELTAYDALKVLADDLHQRGYLSKKITDRDGNPYHDQG